MNDHGTDPTARLKDAGASDPQGRSALKTPRVRAQLIERIKQRVQSGAYRPNAQIIARKILQEPGRSTES